MNATSLRERPKAWARGLSARHGALTLGVLAAILALALGLRVERALDPIDVPGPDSDAYSAISSHLYKTGEYGTPGMENENDWSPGAVLVYTGIYVATDGVREQAARLAVAFLGALLVLVVYALARRLARAASLPEAPAGLLAALAAAVYPAFIYDAGRLMSEPFGELTLALFVLALLWAAEPGRSPWSYALPGALLGLTSLFRPEYLPFSLLFALLILLWTSTGSRYRTSLVFLVAFALVIAPWTIRNAIVLDRFVPVSTGGGKALFIGTYMPGDGDHFRTKRQLYYSQNPDSELPPERVDRLAMQPILDRVAARRPELERDAALAAEGRENLNRHISEQPLELVAMMGRKVWRMWRSGSGPAMDAVAPAILHGALCLLGLAGLIGLAIRRRREAIVLGVLVIGITAIGAVLLASTRRNLILMPLVISLAGVTFAWLLAAVRDRRSRSTV